MSLEYRHVSYTRSYITLTSIFSLFIFIYLYNFSTTLVFREVVTVCINEINGQKTQAKVYNKLASMLSITKQDVTTTIGALSTVFIEGAKKNATPDDFQTSLYDLGFNETQAQICAIVYAENHESIRDSLKLCADVDGRFDSITWRLDIELASRSVRNLNRPTYLLDIKTKHKDNTTSSSDAGVKSDLLYADYATLAHVTEELEKAIKESKTVHARRITRYVK